MVAFPVALEVNGEPAGTLSRAYDEEEFLSGPSWGEALFDAVDSGMLWFHPFNDAIVPPHTVSVDMGLERPDIWEIMPDGIFIQSYWLMIVAFQS